MPTLTATGSVSLAKDDRHQAEEREPRRGQIGPHRLQVAGMACQRSRREQAQVGEARRAAPDWSPSGARGPEGQAVRLLRFWLDV